MKSKYLVFGFILVFSIFAISFSSASYTRSVPQYTMPGFTYSTSSFSNAGFNYDGEMCQAGQDFLVQIEPFGCSPAVVRSDLLEEQNVAVFCQLSAIKLNPLISVEAIESMTFQNVGSSKGIATIGFHPNQAALGFDNNLNNAVENNIGYAVIVLKQNPNESSMPDYVNGTVRATIRYDIENAFGIGRASFYLPVLSDEEWEQRYGQYGFWNGKGFVRAESVDENSATISIFSGNVGTLGSRDYGQRISTVNLDVGETSNEVYLPNFDYCLGGAQFKLEGVENPDTHVLLSVGGDRLELSEKEYFLDNKCQVRQITQDGLNQFVKIRCKEDEKTQTFDLSIVPKMNLTINGVTSSYEIGDYLYTSDDDKKGVYLGYAGVLGDGNDLDDLKVYLFSSPDKSGEALTERELSSFRSYVGRYQYKTYSDVGILNFVLNIGKTYGVAGEALYNWLAHGETFEEISLGESYEFKGAEIKFEGLSGAVDSSDFADTNGNYKEAMNEFDTLIASFPDEVENEYAEPFGERALYEKIILAGSTGQKLSMLKYCEQFEDTYPNSNIILPEYCSTEITASSDKVSKRVIVIDSEVKEIVFEDVYEPSYEEYHAEFTVTTKDGDLIPGVVVGKNEVVPLGDSEYFQLVSLSDGKATINYQVDRTVAGEILETTITGESKTISEGSSFSAGDYIFKLDSVYLEKVAKVTVADTIVNNARGNATFNFQIGIEKRAIQLSPEKAQSKADELTEKISAWEEASEALSKTVQGFKTACLSASAVFTVSNFLENVGGKGIARQKVMRVEGGWYDFCASATNSGTYNSQDECLTKNSDEIDKDVNQMYELIQTQNKEIDAIEDKYTDSSVLKQNVVDTDKFMADYTGNVQGVVSGLDENLINSGNEKDPVNFDDLSYNLNYDSWKNGNYDVDTLKEIELYSKLLESDSDNEIARNKLYSLLKGVQVNAGNYAEIERSANEFGISSSDISFFVTNKDSTELPYHGLVYSDISNSVSISGISDSQPVEVIQTSDSDKIVAVLDDSLGGEKLPILRDDIQGILYVYDFSGNLLSVEKRKSFEKVYFKKYDRSTYENVFKYSSGENEPVVRYYETDPYQGLPAVVPFDLNNGWYAATKTTLSTTSSTVSYDESGRVNSYWLCNVGENGVEEFSSGLGDDICQMLNLGTGQAYDQFYGLDTSEASKLIAAGVDAIEDASRAYTSGVSKVRISTSYGTFNIKVGSPATEISDVQCQDFMSPKECNILFNLCDPVICPSSRCDFGGAYPVKDVIQTGIIGSLALCFPNYKEGIKIPVCLTGVQAGVDNWVSIQKSYRDCLETSAETGETVGICDEIYSIYACEFFWEQALPLAKLAIPKVMSVLSGQNTRGGGEYLTVQDAWNTASNSVQYLTQVYAVNSYNAFKVRSSEDVGSAVCKSYASLSVPEGETLFSSLTQPDSPAQFTGSFDEIEYTTVTNPPTSQYKVYYHIYAGNDRGAYYQVYLQGDSTSSFYQDTAFRRTVDSGYVSVGDYASETVDFTAPSGYTEMCIVVNGDEQCGFKEVSTSFAVNYVSDQYLAEQATTEVKTESECISGTVSLYSLIGLNAQASVSSLIDPGLYAQGITRVCATDSPGAGSDARDGTEDARWVAVGYCGSENIICWLDTESVEDAIITTTIEDETLEEASENFFDIINEDGNYIKDFDLALKNISDEPTITKKISLIDDIIDRVFFNDQKATLHYLRGQLYAYLATNDYEAIASTETDSEDVEETTSSFIESIEITSKEDLIFEFVSDDASIFRFSFIGGEWNFAVPYDPEEDPNRDSNLDLSLEEIGVRMYSAYESFDDGNYEYWSNLYNQKLASSFDFSSSLTDSWTEFEPVSNYESSDKLEGVGSAFVGVLKNLNRDNDDYEAGLERIYKSMVGNGISNGNPILSTGYADFYLYDDVNSFALYGIEDGQESSDLYLRYEYNNWWASVLSPEIIDEVDSRWRPVEDMFERESGALVRTDAFAEFDEFVEYEDLLQFLYGANFYDGMYRIFEVTKVETVCVANVETPADLEGLSDPRAKVLAALNLLEGVSTGSFSNCWDAASYIYSFAGVTTSCIYADSDGKTYDISGTQISTKASNAGVFQVASYPSRDCVLNKNNLSVSEDLKLDSLSAGDLISYVWNENAGHNAVFVEWVNEDERIAKLFDWNGPGRTFRFYEHDLSDSEHPVYMYWGPAGTSLGVSTPVSTSADSNNVDIPQKYITSYEDKLSDLFEQYSKENLPSGMDVGDFKALLVAISQKETGVGTALAGASSNDPGTDWLMGYTVGGQFPEKYRGAENQISSASFLIKAAYEDKSSLYSACTGEFGDDKVECILSVYNSGKKPGLFNPTGNAYSKEVLEFRDDWKNYFS